MNSLRNQNVLKRVVTSILVVLAGCAARDEAPSGPLSISLRSDAFDDGGAIPKRFTCDGDDVSPPLAWSEPPPRTKSLALIVDDPDAPAGTFTHWVLFNLPANRLSLEAGFASNQSAGPAKQGTNDFGKAGYGGPCPPSGTHHYIFHLYALDALLNLDTGAGRGAVLSALKGHILAEGRLTGTYARR